MFAPINPRLPATRSSDSTLRWSSKGLSINLANANTWTGAQTFSNTAAFNSTVNLNSTTQNYGTFYNYSAFYNSGTFDTATLNATGAITTNDKFRAAPTVAGYYQYPYASSYYLTNYPVVPYSVGGTASDGGSIYDDGTGGIYSSYTGQIATLDYNTGIVTGLSMMYVNTNYIYYNAGAATYAEITSAGLGSFYDGNNTVYLCNGTDALNVTGRAIFNSGISDYNQVSVIDVNGKGLYDGSSYQALDWSARQLKDSNGNLILAWGSTIQIGNTDYTEFDATGHQTMVGAAQPWEDLRVEPTVKQAAGVGVPAFEKYFDDSAGTSKGVFLYSFTDESVAGNEKEVYFTAQMPHAWNSGEIKIHVHFAPAATVNTSDIRFGLEYCMKEPGEVYGDTTIVYSSTTLFPDDANITAGKHYIAQFSGITPDTTQDGLSTILICRLFRNSSNGADTYTNKVGLLYVDVHYQMARLGSNDEYTA